MISKTEMCSLAVYGLQTGAVYHRHFRAVNKIEVLKILGEYYGAYVRRFRSRNRSSWPSSPSQRAYAELLVGLKSTAADTPPHYLATEMRIRAYVSVLQHRPVLDDA